MIFTKPLLVKKIFPILFLSVVIIAIFMTIGDLGLIIEQTTGEKNTENLGMVKNCKVSMAVCSITASVDGKRIRIAMSIGEDFSLIKGTTKDFPVDIIISGVHPQQTSAVSMGLEIPGINMQENKHHLQLYAKDKLKLSSHWKSRLKLPQIIKGRNDWLATIDVLVAKKTLKVVYSL